MEHVDVGPASTPILVELSWPTALRADDLAGGLGRSVARSLGRHLRSHLSHADGDVNGDYCGLALAHGQSHDYCLLELLNGLNELRRHLKPHHELSGEASGG